MARHKFDVDGIFKKMEFIKEYNYYSPKRSNFSSEQQLDEADEETDAPEDTETDETNAADSGEDVSADELGLGDLESANVDDAVSADDASASGETMDTAQPDMSAMGGEMDAPVGGEGDIEVDVTDIVDSAEKNSQEISDVNQKIDDILSKFTSFSNEILKVNTDLTGKINGLQGNIEKEFRKRNPTPNEQLQMQSLSSYPYNQKLTDFWQPVDKQLAQSEIQNAYGNSNNNTYEISNANTKSAQGLPQEDEEPIEYKITQGDIDKPMSDYWLKNSF